MTWNSTEQILVVTEDLGDFLLEVTYSSELVYLGPSLIFFLFYHF